MIDKVNEQLQKREIRAHCTWMFDRDGYEVGVCASFAQRAPRLVQLFFNTPLDAEGWMDLEERVVRMYNAWNGSK